MCMDHIIYINLAHRTDRKEHVEQQLSAFSSSFIRMNAVRHEYGAIGCALSHIRCLEYAKQHNWETVCIVEDDITFTNPDVLKNALVHTLQHPWDVILLGTNMAMPFDRVNEHCVRVYNAQTTTGYIVHQRYYDTLLVNFKEGVEGLNRCRYPPVYAIDMYWKRLQQYDHWYALTPLTVTQLPGYSDIERKHVDYSNAMLSLKN
jgi:glycosyl transferase family 25